MGKVKRQDTTCIVAVAVALVAVLATTARPLAAQEVIELTGEDRLLDADFEEIYRMGSLDGGGWDTFGEVADLSFDGAGNLYILDTQAMRISVVDTEGNLVRQFIGEGEGPGEFQGEFAGGLRLAVMRDARVGVYDPGTSGLPSLMQTASSNAPSQWAGNAGDGRSFRTFKPSRERSGCSPRPGSHTCRDLIQGPDPGSGTS